MRVVPRRNDEMSSSPQQAETPLLNTEEVRTSSPPSEQPPVTYASIQRAGFKQIFAPSPTNSPVQTPLPTSQAFNFRTSSPTTDRVLSPDNPTPPMQESPKLVPRSSSIPIGGVPSILRAVSPLSEESTTSSIPDSPPKLPIKLGFKERLMKQPLQLTVDTKAPMSQIQEEPGATSLNYADLDFPATQKVPPTGNGNNQRPLSPETDF